MTNFKTLFKQTSTGAIQTWHVVVVDNQIITEYGLKDGKLQHTKDVIKAGLNLGKKNETTPEQQADLQAQQMWDAKLKKGYVTDLTQAESTTNTLGAIAPMLAFPVEKKEKYVVFPALAQPKLDGLRCIAIIKGGKAQLFSRTQKPITTMPHIVAELERLYKGNVILDGELYAHRFNDDFNELIHLIKRDDVHDDGKLIEYHVYDIVAPGSYYDRIRLRLTADHIVGVETVTVRSRAELDAYQAECVERGFEGCMYRNPVGQYENKRSTTLLKVKTFQDAEFKIVGMDEGRGKLMGCAGTINVITKDGVVVKPAPIGGLALQKWYWEHKDEVIGKWGTVKYFGETPDGSLRFPKFKCVRKGGE